MQPSKATSSLVLPLIASIILLTACSTSKTARRYYYDFSAKTLSKTKTSSALQRPIAFSASKDLQLTIFNYNPLKHELIVEESSSSWFLTDMDKLAGMVVFPKTAGIPAPEKKTTETEKAGTEKSAKNPKKPKKAETANCDFFDAYITRFNDQKIIIEQAIQDYKDFLFQIDRIKDDYAYLKEKEVLRPADVEARLSNSFLGRMNSFLTAGDKLLGSPLQVSSREIAAVEQKYMKAVADAASGLDQLKNEVESLQNKPGCFHDLYKKFIGSVSELKDKLKDFISTRTEKILPAFDKNLLVYDQLKKYSSDIPDFITASLPIVKDNHTISIYKKENGKDTKTLHDQINIDPDKGIKIDVSAGFFFSGLQDHSFNKKTSDSIYTKRYLVNGLQRDTTVSGSFTTLFKKDQLPVSFGGMLYLHVHSQNANWVNYGGYIGFGALFNDQTRWAGSLGGSLLLGKSTRFNIHGGVVLSQVDRLSPPYQTSIGYAETIDNIPTYKSWQAGWLLGVSWNLTK
jgi:hypothetical protein